MNSDGTANASVSKGSFNEESIETNSDTEHTFGRNIPNNPSDYELRETTSRSDDSFWESSIRKESPIKLGTYKTNENAEFHFVNAGLDFKQRLTSSEGFLVVRSPTGMLFKTASKRMVAIVESPEFVDELTQLLSGTLSATQEKNPRGSCNQP